MGRRRGWLCGLRKYGGRFKGVHIIFTKGVENIIFYDIKLCIDCEGDGKETKQHLKYFLCVVETCMVSTCSTACKPSIYPQKISESPDFTMKQ